MLSTPETVAPIAGALNQRSGAPDTGGCVAVLLLALRMLMLTWSERDAPDVSNTVALRVCVPLPNLVVSIKHCRPLAGVLSILSAAPSRKNAARATLPLEPM